MSRLAAFDQFAGQDISAIFVEPLHVTEGDKRAEDSEHQICRATGRQYYLGLSQARRVPTDSFDDRHRFRDGRRREIHGHRSF